MIDFHSHVLHDIDDGSHSVEESIEMMKMSYRQGIDTMVFTPHFRLGEHNIRTFLQERRDRLDEIREALTEEDRREIPKVILGAEIEYIPGMNHWDYLPELCITGTKYIICLLYTSRDDLKHVFHVPSLGQHADRDDPFHRVVPAVDVIQQDHVASVFGGGCDDQNLFPLRQALCPCIPPERRSGPPAALSRGGYLW